MLTVGLTGGIASGKTTVSNLFAELGVPIIDADVLSRNLLDPGEKAYTQVIQHFGESIVTEDQRIDRKRLRQLIFTQPEEKHWIETMLHPLIYQRCHQAIQKHASAAYLLLVVPLLFESNFQTLVDRICVVSCPAEIQLERLVKRDHIEAELAGKMIAQQLSNQQRVARAHDIIDNKDDQADLSGQVNALHQKYLELSNA